jgi:DeoR/GlpR family transcriptional regulator of sugar metabolism
MSFIIDTDQIDYLITDKDIPDEQAQGFIDKGVKVIIV